MRVMIFLAFGCALTVGLLAVGRNGLALIVFTLYVSAFVTACVLDLRRSSR